MTSFIIKAQVDRPPSSWMNNSDCTFCSIVRNEQPAFRVFENELVIAILDIMPLRQGHTLVIPKAHYSRVSELPPEIAAAVGQAVSKVARALTEAMENTSLNVVCNQEYAQAVPHVHYHIIPPPNFSRQPEGEAKVFKSHLEAEIEAPLTRRQMHRMEFESRQELEPHDADLLVGKIRSRL